MILLLLWSRSGLTVPTPAGPLCCRSLRPEWSFRSRGYGVSERGDWAVVGSALAALVLGSTMLGNVPGISAAATQPVSMLAAKKKAGMGTLSITVSGSGSYTVTGKGFRKAGTASKSFKLKPGVYTVKAPTGSVTPGKAKVRKGKATRVKVTFPTGPSTPTPTETPPVPTPTPGPSDTPTSPPPPPPPSPPGATGVVQRVSTADDGSQAAYSFDGSFESAWSPDGTRIAFASAATNLVPGDTNNTTDVFVKNLATGAIQRISTDSVGTQANGWSRDPVWSPDGTKIAFASFAYNLVPGDAYGGPVAIFVKTLASGAIQRVSADSTGIKANGDSWDTPGFRPSWSPDSTRIAFTSMATNLVPSDTNGVVDVFVKTLVSGAIERISVDATGAQATNSSGEPAWSPDGTKIAFASSADNLAPGDSNHHGDVLVKTLASGVIQMVSLGATGTQAHSSSMAPAWSPDGTKIAFNSGANNLVPGDTNDTQDVFAKTLASGAIQRISTDAAGIQGNDYSESQIWSPDGTKIAFISDSDNLVSGDTNDTLDVFVKTLASGAIQVVSADAIGAQGDKPSDDPEWSPDGTKLAFTSTASNLISGDTNDARDVFVKTLG